MNITLWIVAGLLALAFLGAGAMKVARSKEQLAASGLSWTEDFSAPMVKAIGALEILGALGLVLPAVTGILPVLVPLAALGLTATMAGAVIVHLRRRETFIPPAVLLVLAAFVAVGRFLVPIGA
ncbi:MAG TPA: DoxX family protein [Micropruina sp.]|nr:DoxX family protein [Micropruina sp.]HMR21067.1 DoxX family protein [Micropruina sp.]